MKRLSLLLAGALLLQLQASEPSVFGAGNLDSDSPYGLTESEKKIVENRQNLKNTKRKSQENSAQLQSLRERIDGLQTIIEGLAEKTQENKLKVTELTSGEDIGAQRDARIAALEEAVRADEANIASLKTLLESMATQVDAINANYVSKDEFNALVGEINAFKRDLGKTLKSVSAPAAGASLESKSSKELAAEAKASYNKLFFKDAIPMYEELIRRNYKPAYAHFMIGEMWHYRKEWSKALSYFKESAARSSKTSFMPTLMLHSAECMMHTGDSANAKKFLRSLIAKYPASGEAAEAERLLNTL
ncbi:tetratricopeptide repeat protein [Sulfurimonas sp. HSL-3221]|uniref:tetratricopeptide repeat protein n=1 Tax=Sulfurimonadaceae TaxID=2771471 RepID=UPI001E38E449|nr:tetratricopeptide repeat protein [Sulfurimonas sp. HSL-3221]UFS63328.1 tetratricopeptide repeat protein [Sulfurimonas sp. HSL-3221]